MRKLLLLLCCAVPAFAQSNYLTVTVSHGLVDPSGAPLAQGTFCAYATDGQDNPIPFLVGSAYQALKSTVCRNVVNGVLASSLTLANPAATQPLNIRYHFVATNTATRQQTHYPGVSIVTGGSTWDFSSWNPATGIGTIPVNVITGPTGATGAAGAAGPPGGSLSYPSVVSDGAGGLTLTNSVPALAPYADIRHPSYGGVCNGSTDTASAIQAAINAAQGAGGNGVVSIPDNCYTANASGFTNPNTNQQLTINISGTWKIGSTFVKPKGSAIICQGKGNNPQDAFSAPVCIIQMTGVRGTIGTGIVSTNTPVTITPTFTNGSIANLTQGSAITIAENTSCTMSSVTRTALAGTYPTLGAPNAIFTFGSPCSIPSGSLVAITGCSDTSFNAPGIPSGTADFTAKTMGIRMVGSGTTVTDTSCVITGFDVHSIETERIESVSGSTITLRTTKTHASTALFGEVGMAGAYFDLSYSVIQGVTVTGNYGAGFWGDGNTALYFNGDSFNGVGFITSIAMDLSTTYGIVFDKSQTNGTGFSTQCPTVTFPNCYGVGPPFDIYAEMLPQSLFATNALSMGKFESSTIRHGIYMSSIGSLNNAYYFGPYFDNSVIEQPEWNGVTFDSRTTGQIYSTHITESLMQDAFGAPAWVGMTDAPAVSGAPRGQVFLYDPTDISVSTNDGSVPPIVVNNHFCGQVYVGGANLYNTFAWPACPQATVTFEDGRSIVGELNTPPVSPAYIPHATLNTNQTASSWTVSGAGSTITSGQLDPWGGTNAALITAPSGTYAQTTVFSAAQTTSANDVYLYSVWSTGTNSNGNPAMGLTTFGADTFDRTDNQSCATAVAGLYWHSTVCTSTVLTGASAHTLQFYISPLQSAGGGSGYFSNPCVIHILASENIPAVEIQRWRTEMLHGYCPSNLSTTVPAFAIAPNVYQFTGAGLLPTTIYSAAGTALPSCVSGLKGMTAWVSDATSPTYRGTYTSGGSVFAPVMCNGSTWETH